MHLDYVGLIRLPIKQRKEFGICFRLTYHIKIKPPLKIIKQNNINEGQI